MKNLILFLLLCTSLFAQAQGTYTLSGTVKDTKGQTIPGATIFIADSQMATAADRDGKFVLADVPPGNYNISVKMLGFELHQQPVTIQSANVNLTVLLKESNTVLKQVNISGMSKEMREKLLGDFLKNLLGNSANAPKCKLLNPDVVNVSFQRGNNGVFGEVYEANSDDFLIIENRALGYKLHYLLTRYKLVPFQQMLSYSGTLFFEPMKGSKSEQERWAKNRREAYEGSIMHFFRAVYANTLDEQQFLVYKLPYGPNYQAKTKAEDLKPYKLPASMFTRIDDNSQLLNLSSLIKDTTRLFVVYTAKNIPDDFKNSMARIYFPFPIPPKKRQVSVLEAITDSLQVDKNGSINPTDGVLRLGYWSWGRAADFLPSDYKLGD